MEGRGALPDRPRRAPYRSPALFALDCSAYRHTVHGMFMTAQNGSAAAVATFVATQTEGEPG
jgi:hypothetical protein